ncbi:hypothetical protein BKA56DRAFT_676899 [Ilyonectria sp. MPI-CAGE-AT-0026]|nr:hypothetical protein BKA56DRAFT_676899 [Ilyonectria sp. MPI-CAGE-AT-0026]
MAAAVGVEMDSPEHTSNLDMQQDAFDPAREIEWPDFLPPAPAPPFAHPLPFSLSLAEAQLQPTLAQPDEWEHLQREEDERLDEIRKFVLRFHIGYLYEHLGNVEIDWDLDGPEYICRVVGLPCYGYDYRKTGTVKLHLHTPSHIRQNDRSPARPLTPKPRRPRRAQS